MKVLILVTIFIIGLVIQADCQYTIKNKKAIKHFEAAQVYFEKFDDMNAMAQLDQALRIDSNFVEALNLYATIYDNKRELEKVIYYLNRAVNANPDYSYKSFYLLGKNQLILGKYSDSKENLTKCLDFSDISPRIEAYANVLLERAEYGITAMANPVDFKPMNLGPNINTPYNDYWPSVTADESMIITTVLLPKDSRYPVSYENSQEDFFVSIKKDGMWLPAQNMGRPINTPDNEGSQVFSPDGRLLFYTVCNRPEDYGSCDIYFSEKIGDEWKKPVNIGPVINTGEWECNPTVSADGRILIFSAGHQRGGQGKKDLWLSRMDKTGNWAPPVNLGEEVNSEGNDISPFLHPDGKTLYFSSDGHMGLGGMDIFMSRLDQDGKWQKPVNMGYPVNTFKDEIGLIVNAKGELAYFSSERDDSRAKDIYCFYLDPSMRPQVVTYVKGRVFDSVTGEGLGASFKLIDLETEEVVIDSRSNEGNGDYLVCIPTDRNYAFNVSKEGYLFFSENFSLVGLDDPSEPFIMDIPLQPLSNGISIELKNIFYETDKYDLKPESRAELNKVIEFLNSNPDVKIEIGGHTDNVGTKEYNQVLSENRAKTVSNYLTNHGIAKNRVQHKGYNFSQPKYPNDTEGGRAKNRRTELKIISIK